MVTRLRCLGTVTVATAGSRVAVFAGLNPQPMVTSVLIRASNSNTGVIYVGDNTVLASSDRGDRLVANGVLSLEGDKSKGGGTSLIDLASIFIDASANGQSVDVIYTEVL